MIRKAVLPVWQAKWIDPEWPHDAETKQPASYLRRRFTIKTHGSARLYITCHGLYAAYLNGQRVGDFVLAPGAGDYNQRLMVQCYDVTGLLKAGENELLVILGDGWYRGGVGVDGLRNYYGSDIALLCQLEMNGQPILISDEQWEVSQQGPIRENDLEIGENYDARLEKISGWHGVTVRDYGFANLAPTESVPVLEQERFPGKRMKTPNGDTVIDFGQNLAGYTELRLTAKAGQKIILWHGETLDENGNFTQANYAADFRDQCPGVPQKIEYICKDGLNEYKPSFTIMGFRYARVETEADLSDAQFTAIAVYSYLPQVGFFECGNADVNQLFHNSLWSMKSNFCDIPTDCPTRERAGWTGDAGLFAPTAVYLADCYPILRKWLGECRLAQEKNGLVANIAPINDKRDQIALMLQGSAGWGDACVLVPWALYQAYGDKMILEENYAMMTRWLSFCENRAKETRPQNEANPWKEYLIDTGFHWGEWLEPGHVMPEEMRKNMMEGVPDVATAYYFRSASLLSRIAVILGKPKDAARYAHIAENAKKAFRFTCTQDGKITSDRQCQYVRPIAFGLLNREENQQAADALNEQLSARWKDLRGIEIAAFGVSSIKATEEDEKMLKEMQRNAALRDPLNAAAHLVGAQADAMKTAAGNAGGAAIGFMGMNMAANAGGFNANNLYQAGMQQQTPAQPAPQSSLKENENSWKCPQCGTLNQGKFCTECGAKKPAGVPQYRCDKCGWVPEDPAHPPKFCPNCGDPFDDGDIVS